MCAKQLAAEELSVSRMALASSSPRREELLRRPSSRAMPLSNVYEEMQEALDFCYSRPAAASYYLSGRRAEVMV